MFLEILQNSQENACVRVSFLIKFKKETLALLFSCEFRKIFTPFLQNTSVRLILIVYLKFIYITLIIHPTGLGILSVGATKQHITS